MSWFGRPRPPNLITFSCCFQGRCGCVERLFGGLNRRSSIPAEGADETTVKVCPTCHVQHVMSNMSNRASWSRRHLKKSQTYRADILEPCWTENHLVRQELDTATSSDKAEMRGQPCLALLECWPHCSATLTSLTKQQGWARLSKAWEFDDDDDSVSPFSMAVNMNFTAPQRATIRAIHHIMSLHLLQAIFF
jgi:hypothetical protein